MKLPRIGPLALAVAAPIVLSAPVARADDTVTVAVSLRNHQFQPAELHAPANKVIMIVVKNQDPTPAEFESNMLRVEKVVTGGGTIKVRIRPLAPGRYRFFDDFHPDTQGYLVAQ